jgi:hypothetical protein
VKVRERTTVPVVCMCLCKETHFGFFIPFGSLKPLTSIATKSSDTEPPELM